VPGNREQNLKWLAVSPQRGFGGTVAGDPLTEADERGEPCPGGSSPIWCGP
jgi:hypothetical protein